MSKPRKDLIDETGNRHGRLVALSYDTANKKWICRCDCGNVVMVNGGDLRRDVVSCGCYRSEKSSSLRSKDISGKRFSRLTVLQFNRKGTNGASYWECKCDCGKVKIVRQGHLSSGNTVSCGCYGREMVKNSVTKHGLYGTPDYNNHRCYLRSISPTKRIADTVGSAIGRALKKSGGVKTGSVWQHLPYTQEELKSHLESLWEPWMNWDNYGGSLDDERKTWHIDHIIPKSSYYYQSMTESDFIECWSLSNLRPLDKIENNRKRCKY